MTKYLKKTHVIKKNIITFEINDPVTRKVTNFYKESPFPNYKSDDNKSTIIKKGNKNFLTSSFKKFIGFNKSILEVGCGTGQLSNYFAIGTNNKVVGLDPTIESIELAAKFSDQNNINNIEYVNADIFDDVLADKSFDFIWCNGVLHHTKDSHGAFKILIKSLKDQGYVLIGLYNKIGRIRTLIRKTFSKIFGKNFLMFMDPTLRNLKTSLEEQKSWIRDQYMHPVEKLHTLDEVLNWFKQSNIDFISSIPSCDFNEDYEDLFRKKSKGSLYSRIVNQIFMIFTKLGCDGGLFIVIGRKMNN
jgi:2-polyprenyl-3-methyl-5-hydroxy-6-metoxy-1,4-benzoquinol methylase